MEDNYILKNLIAKLLVLLKGRRIQDI